MCDYGQGEDSPSGEKSLLKRQQDAISSLAHLAEDCRNRLTFPPRDILERYSSGRLEIRLKLRSRRSGQKFQIAVLSDDAGVGRKRRSIDGHMLTVSVPENQEFSRFQADMRHGQTWNPSDGSKFNVFIPPIEVVKGKQKVIGSFVRFCGPDEILSRFSAGRGQIFCFLFKLSFEMVFTPPEWEIDAIRLPLPPSHLESQRYHHLIKRGSDIVEDFSGTNLNIVGDILSETERPDFLSPIRINLGDDFIRLFEEELIYGDTEIIDLGFGPFDLGKTAPQ